MQFDECVTERERHLWTLWKSAEERVATLSATPPAERRPRSSPAPLSPAALRLHRKRCAARARLFRKRLCLAARRRVLDQARALGVVPADFDQESFLAGIGPRDNAPDFDSARFRRSIGDNTLLAVQTRGVPDANPASEWSIFWIGLRLAKLDGSLGARGLELLERFVDRTPSPSPSAPFALIRRVRQNYGDGVTPARSWTGMPLYPNGRAIREDTGFIYYPSGLCAFEKPSGAMSYPDGSPFRFGPGDWMAPDRTMGRREDVVAWVRDAAGRLWPAIELGLRRLRPELNDLAWLELAWVLLGPDSS